MSDVSAETTAQEFGPKDLSSIIIECPEDVSDILQMRVYLLRFLENNKRPFSPKLYMVDNNIALVDAFLSSVVSSFNSGDIPYLEVFGENRDKCVTVRLVPSRSSDIGLQSMVDDLYTELPTFAAQYARIAFPLSNDQVFPLIVRDAQEIAKERGISLEFGRDEHRVFLGTDIF